MAIVIQIALVITIICSCILGLLIYQNYKLSLLHKLLVAHLISITCWAAAALIVLRHESWFAIKIGYAAAAMLAVTKYYFISLFPKTEYPRRISDYLPLFATSSIVYASLFSNSFVADFTVVDSTYILITDGPHALIYLSLILLLLSAPIVTLFKKLHSNQYQGTIANQIRFLLIGVSFFFILGFATNSILPVVFGVYYFNGIGPSLALILASIIFYIISRHNFLNLSIIIQRGFIYSVLIGGIAIAYLSILFILNNLIHHSQFTSPLLGGLLTSIIGIISFPHLELYLRRKTDRFFYRDHYNPSLVLQHLSEELNRSIEISRLKLHTNKILQQALKCSFVQLELYSIPLNKAESKPVIRLTKQNLIVSLVSNKSVVGALTLHPKRSGEPYSKTDREFLIALSYQLGLACERALLYQQLKDYAKELEYKVQQRTTELQTAHQNQKLMLSQIAHGLQSPLTIINNEIESLKQIPEFSSRAILVEHSLTSLSQFIYDLLRVSQFESTNHDFELLPINLSLILDDICNYMELLCAERSISFNYTIVPSIIICGDQKRIQELLHTLLGNALKYLAPNGQRGVYVSLNATGIHAIIEITDTGIGIPEADIPMIFNRFYRVRTNSNIPGSGLGLSIAKAIVHKHGGTIDVTSTLGVGTTFVVTLPLAT